MSEKTSKKSEKRIKKDYWIRVGALSILELQNQQWSERKMYLVWKMIENKIDPTRQIYIYINAKEWYLLLWQPVNPNYQPEEFTVTNNDKPYHFIKPKKWFLSE